MAGRVADQAARQVLKEMAAIQVPMSKVGKRRGSVAQQVRARTPELELVLNPGTATATAT